MIIIIGMPVIILGVIIWAVFTAVCAAIFGIQNSWAEDRVEWLKVYTVKQKWGLFAVLLAWMASVAAVIYSFFYHTGGLGTAGMIGWVITSLIAAYTCSPLQVAFLDGWKGCHPVLSLARFISFLLIMAVSWIFLLLAIFRKATWRLYVGIVAALFGIMICVTGGVVGYLLVSRNNQMNTAAEAASTGNYEDAMAIYYGLDEQELLLETWYAYGMDKLNQGDYFSANRLFAELDAEYQYADAAEQARNALYTWAKEEEEAGNYPGASIRYGEVGNYKDAAAGYQRCCDLEGCRQMADTYFDKAAEWFAQAGDYEDARILGIYCQARILAGDNLMAAEELLLLLPREFRDVDTMLTAIETYRSWPGRYALKESSGQNPRSYTEAILTLVYEQQWIEEVPTMEWEVALVVAGKATEYGSEGVIPEWGTLKFTTGTEEHWNEFSVTEKRITVVNVEIDSKYGWRSERTYVFDRTEG